MSATAERPTIGIRELRQNASRYVAMAEQGITVNVTRRGLIVASLIPWKHSTRSKEEDTLQQLYAAGLLRPAEDPGSVLDIVPVKGTSDVSATEILLQMREEERF